MAFYYLAKLIAKKDLRIEKGHIKLKESDLTLIPSHQITIETKYHLKANSMPQYYLKNWMWGLRFAYAVTKQLHLNNPEEVFHRGMDLIENMGLGVDHDCAHEVGKFTQFSISDNPYLVKAGSFDSSQPLDYFISGLAAGEGCLVHGNLVQNIELECRLSGSKACKFLSGTEDELKRRGLWNLVENRYSIDKILPLQTKYYNALFSESQERLERIESEVISEMMTI